jgi:hypothetical protein
VIHSPLVLPRPSSLLAVTVLLVACGTNPPSWQPDAGPCKPYNSTADLTMPKVTFKADVLPVLGAHCASTACHGDAKQPTGSLFLGAASDGGADADTVYAALVGPSSTELTGMKLVTPSDVARSFVMHKVDGDQCQYESPSAPQTCTGNNCGRAMPQNATTLDVDTRDILRRWIAQGADNS